MPVGMVLYERLFSRLFDDDFDDAAERAACWDLWRQVAPPVPARRQNPGRRSQRQLLGVLIREVLAEHLTREPPNRSG